jgi:hypothetical protein
LDGVALQASDTTPAQLVAGIHELAGRPRPDPVSLATPTGGGMMAAMDPSEATLMEGEFGAA